MGVSKNNGIPKSSLLLGFSIINHPFWGTFIFGNTQYESIQHESWLFTSPDVKSSLADDQEAMVDVG